jgi:tripartite-type tricarboxylate transporter receptor subunit TctC
MKTTSRMMRGAYGTVISSVLAYGLVLPGAFAGEPSAGYPVKPVRFVSPFSPGGGTDAVGRIIAAKLSEAMGRTFLVDNRAGAEGVIGTELAARSQADGYTLLVANLGTFCVVPNLRKVGYDPMKSFAPITQTTSSSTVLVVHPAIQATTVKELVMLARAKPGQISYGTSSSGTALPMHLLMQMAGVSLNEVPYKGSGPVLIALLSGEVKVTFGGAMSTVPLIRSGRLRALAVAGDRRAKALPDVPTVAEAGFPGYEANSWNGIVAPAGTPRSIVQTLNAAIGRVLQLPDLRNSMVADGAEPVASSPEEFVEYIARCHAKWSRVIRNAGLKENP